ncbi:MAG: DUF1295 domain-containing protein [Actinobacteria bacterium]|nr:DUF1295 domain-containing protein [Actinomycetota bacterium]
MANFASDGSSDVGLIVAVMVSIWGLRLAGYLWWRNHGKGEDFATWLCASITEFASH